MFIKSNIFASLSSFLLQEYCIVWTPRNIFQIENFKSLKVKKEKKPLLLLKFVCNANSEVFRTSSRPKFALQTNFKSSKGFLSFMTYENFEFEIGNAKLNWMRQIRWNRTNLFLNRERMTKEEWINDQ